jgi:hypothetical protein
MMRNLGLWASVVLIAILAHSFRELFTYRPVTVQRFEIPTEAARPFEGEAEIRITAYEPTHHELSADLIFKVEAVDATHEIQDLAYSLTEDWVAEERSWRYPVSAQHFERTRAGSDVVVDALEITEKLSLPIETVRQPILYPFDRYRLDLSIRACANSGGNACLGNDNLFLKKLSIDYSALGFEPGLVVESGPPNEERLSFYLKRNNFLRLASLLLLGAALCFFFYLVFLYRGDDLLKGSLGYFGALWALRGLIVPKSVTLFPTAVDYIVLTIFTVLFFVLFFSMIRGRKETPKPSGGPT